MKSTKINIPPSAVEKQLRIRLDDVKQRMKQQGLKQEDIDKKTEEMQKDMRTAAEKDLKVYFIFDKIAEVENIHIHQGENMVSKVLEFLLKEANWEEDK